MSPTVYSTDLWTHTYQRMHDPPLPAAPGVHSSYFYNQTVRSNNIINFQLCLQTVRGGRSAEAPLRHG